MVIKYDYDFILSIKNNYIINASKLENLKEFNTPQITLSKKQQQMNIKYQSNKWRYNDKEDLFKKKLNGVLNKISLDNYDELKNIIQNIGNNINVDKFNDMDYFTERIVNKAIDDPFYSPVYGKLLKDICKLKWFCVNITTDFDTTYVSFYELLLHKIKQLYDEIYNCENNNKNNCVNIIELINQIYINNLISHTVYISCVYGLLNNPNELNIELVCKMISKTGEKIKEKNIKDIISKMSIIYTSTSNSRLKYMLLDIIELYNSGWENKADKKIIVNDIDDKINGILDEYMINDNIDDILYILEKYEEHNIIRLLDLGIKYCFNFNKEQQNLLFELLCTIIIEHKIGSNRILNILDSLVTGIDDLIMDSPNCLDPINRFFLILIQKKLISEQDISKLFETKTLEKRNMFKIIDTKNFVTDNKSFTIVGAKKTNNYVRDLSALKDKNNKGKKQSKFIKMKN